VDRMTHDAHFLFRSYLGHGATGEMMQDVYASVCRIGHGDGVSTQTFGALGVAPGQQGWYKNRVSMKLLLFGA
jgi:hypothetical protein